MLGAFTGGAMFQVVTKSGKVLKTCNSVFLAMSFVNWYKHRGIKTEIL